MATIIRVCCEQHWRRVRALDERTAVAVEASDRYVDYAGEVLREYCLTHPPACEILPIGTVFA